MSSLSAALPRWLLVSSLSAASSHVSSSAEPHWQAEAGHCDGPPVSTVALPLHACIPQNVSGQFLFIKFSCGAAVITEGIWYYNPATPPPRGEECAAAPNQTYDIPANACFSDRAARGLPGLWTCNVTHAISRHYRLAPPVPVARCGAAGAAGSLPVVAEVNASEVAQVSFSVGRGGAPFLSYRAPVGSYGTVAASIPGVRPNTHYSVQARALARGENEGNPAAWSTLSVAVNCSAGSGTGKDPSAPVTSSEGVKTRVIEVIRSVSGGSVVPDFLDQHNAFDIVSAASTLGVFNVWGGFPDATPLVRYCVEIEDVELQGVVTEDTSGLPKSSHFSDYESCVGGECGCMVTVDRTWARMPKEQIFQMCHAPSIDNRTAPPGSMYDCDCPKKMSDQSRRYVGRAPVPLPVQVELALPQLKTFPQTYPLPTLKSPIGHIFHFPSAGRCKLGAPIGDSGCTWQLSPLSHTIFFGDLKALGANLTVLLNQSTQEVRVPAETAVHNAEVIRTTLEHVPVDVPPCRKTPLVDSVPTMIVV